MEKTWDTERRTKDPTLRERARASRGEMSQVPVRTSGINLGGEACVRGKKAGRGQTPKGLNNRERSLNFVLEAVGTIRSF